MNTQLYNRLIIKVSLNEFSFGIKNKLNNEISHLKSISLNQLAPLENQLEVIFSKNELLQVSYDDILVLHDNSLNTFVPSALFDADNLGSYLQYNVKIFPTDYFDYDEISSHQLQNIYIPYVQFNNFFIDQFGGFTFKNVNTAFLEYILQTDFPSEVSSVYSCISEHHFEVIVMKGNEFIFFNSFEYQTAQDFIYYILFVFEQLKLDTHQHTLHLFGQIDTTSELFTLAYTYIKNIVVYDHKTQASVFNITEDELKKHFILLNS